MFTLEFEWKEFPVCLQMVESFLRALDFSSAYGGACANSKLMLRFTRELTAEESQLVQDYWNSIAADSDEAVNYVSKSQIDARMVEIKEGMMVKSWDELTLVERKVLLNRAVSNVELGF